jgi:RNA polymerase sigma factor (sigma-70 family)
MLKMPKGIVFRVEQRPLSAPPQLGRVADPEDIQWLASLYDEYSDRIRDVILRHGGPGTDAEDLLHEVFLAAHRKIGLLRAYVDPGGWLHLAALREVWKVKRRGRLWAALSLGLVSQPQEQCPQESAFLQHESARWVYAVLNKLPLGQREALVLFYFEGLTSIEIGRLLGCPEETVRSRIFHGKRSFMKVVDREVRRSLSAKGTPR